MRLSGDKEKARELERRARSYVGYLFDQMPERQKFRSQAFGLEDGSSIVAYVWKDKLGTRAIAKIYASPGLSSVPVIAEFVILESGLLQIVNEGGGTLSTTLYLGDTIPLQYVPQFDLTGDATVNESDRLFPVGAITVGDPASAPIVGNIDPSTYTPSASQMPPLDLYKIRALLLPPSVFTGKLRLYVQSLYGSVRPDVLVNLTSPSTWPTLEVDSFPIPYRSADSCFLITTDDWQYWLGVVDLDYGTNEVTLSVYKLVPYSTNTASAAYRLYLWALAELQDKFATGQSTRDDAYGASNKAALETIVLSFLKPDATAFYTNTQSCPAANFPHGSPMAYGWHANWDGSEAKITLVTTDTAGFAIAGREITLTISHTISLGVVSFSFSCSVGTGVTTKTLNDFYVWEPQGTYQTSASSWLNQVYMCGIEDSGNATIPYPAPEECTDLPLYGWYDVDNNWVSCSFSRSDEGIAYTNAALPTSVVCHGSSISNVANSKTSSVKKWILKVGGETKEAYSCADADARISTYEVTSGTSGLIRSDVTNNSSGAYTQCAPDGAFPGYDGPTGTAAWFDLTYPVVKFTIQDNNSLTYSGAVALVLPHDDCDAALGISYQLAYSNRIQIQPPDPTQLGKDSGAIYTQITEDIDGVIGTEVLWSGTDIRGTTTAVISSNGAGTSTNYDAISRTVISATLVDQKDITEVASYAANVNGSTSPGADFEWDGGLASLPSPFGPVNSNGANWGVFTEAPINVCSADNRDITQTPAVQVSAIYSSKLGRGLPSEIQDVTNDGFTAGSSFVGFA
jgi:hypothetical protein